MLKINSEKPTGPPGVGKTTAVKKICQALIPNGQNAIGFYTEELRENGKRSGFDIVSLEGSERRPLARVDAKNHRGPKVGTYTVFVEDFEKLALPILDSYRTDSMSIVCIDDDLKKIWLLIGKYVVNSFVCPKYAISQSC